MIIVELDTELLLVSQPEHAHLAAELVRLWKKPPLRELERYDDLLFATREHDNGWQELDSTPMWDFERNRPYDFLTLPESERHELWRRGTQRFRIERPYVAALIAQHAHHLLSHDHHTKTVALEQILEELAATRNEVLEELGISLDQLLVDYDYLELVDLISLATCCQWGREFRLHGYRFELAQPPGESPGRLSIEPFPLAGSTTFSFRARRIERKSYRGDADLALTTMQAPLEKLEFRVTPASGSPKGRLERN